VNYNKTETHMASWLHFSQRRSCVVFCGSFQIKRKSLNPTVKFKSAAVYLLHASNMIQHITVEFALS